MRNEDLPRAHLPASTRAKNMVCFRMVCDDGTGVALLIARGAFGAFFFLPFLPRAAGTGGGGGCIIAHIAAFMEANWVGWPLWG